MRQRVAATAVLLVLGMTATPGLAENPDEPLWRVEHHLREAGQIARHFEQILAGDCPRFTTPEAWRDYLDGEVDRMVTLLAHVEQAWVEAKRTKDDEVRRTAKAPRRQLDQAWLHVERLQLCAADNGATFAPLAMWRRIEREVPQRQAAIALPP